MKRPNAYTVFILLEGINAFFWMMIVTVNLVYQATTVGLSPLQLVLVGTWLEATALVCEVPTGVVADVYSRRLSIIIGWFLIGVGFVVEGSFPFFGAVLLSQVIWGMGYTFTSGATEAWITDEIGAERAGQAFIRALQVGHVCALLGIGAGTLLGNLQINVPIVTGGVGFMLLAVLMAFIMPERGFKPTARENRNSFQAMAHTLREGVRAVRGRPTLITILTIGIVYGAWSEGFDRLWTKHLLDNFTFPTFVDWQPVVWFGLLRAITTVLGLGASEFVRRRVNTNSHAAVARALQIATAVMCVGAIIFSLAGNFALAIVAYCLIVPMRSVNEPLQTAWLNQNLDSQIRATVISMRSQADAVGQIAGGPAVGAVGNLSLRAALAVSSVLLAPAVWLYARTLREGQGAVSSEPSAVGGAVNSGE